MRLSARPLASVLLGVALGAALAACEVITDPLPANPFDPAFDGPRRVTAPTDLRLASATPTSVTLAWADQSSFERGFRIERRLVLGSLSQPYSAVATLPPDAAQYTDADLRDVRTYEYRVVALSDPGGVDAASPTLRVRYPVATRAPIQSLDFNRFSPAADMLVSSRSDGFSDEESTLLRWFRSPAGVSLGTVRVDGRLDLRGVGGNRFVSLDAGAATPRRVVFVTPAGLERAVTLEGSGACTSAAFSADGRFAAATCPLPGGGPSVRGVWDLATGARLHTLPSPGGSGPNAAGVALTVSLSGDLALFASPDGAVGAYVPVTGEARWVRLVADGFPRGAALSADGQAALVWARRVNREGWTVQAFNAQTGVPTTEPVESSQPPHLDASGAFFTRVTFMSGSGYTVDVMRTATGEPVRRVPGPTDRFILDAQTLPGASGLVIATFDELLSYDFTRAWEVSP